MRRVLASVRFAGEDIESSIELVPVMSLAPPKNSTRTEIALSSELFIRSRSSYRCVHCSSRAREFALVLRNHPRPDSAALLNVPNVQTWSGVRAIPVLLLSQLPLRRRQETIGAAVPSLKYQGDSFVRRLWFGPRARCG